MKTVKQILEHRTVIKTGILAEGKKLKKADETKIPTVIVLQRKAIRVFPDDQKIALYYSQALDKHVSIPFGPKNDALGIHLSEETLDEALPVIGALGAAARFAAPYVARGLGAAARGAVRAGKWAGRAIGRGARRVAGAAAMKAYWEKMKKAERDPGKAFTRPDDKHQFGRELAKVGSSSQAQSTVDPSAAKQQLRAFGGAPQGYYRESTNLSKIKTIVENKTKKDEITFQDGKSVEITERVAKKILGIYESLNKDNKKNLEKMLNEDIVSFRKVVNFAIRQ